MATDLALRPHGPTQSSTTTGGPMKVKMTVSITGTRDGQDWPGVGQVVDLPDDEAQSYIEAGIAAEVDAPPPEAATPREPITEPQQEHQPAKPAEEPTKKAAGSKKAAASA